ncbi:MAG: radical SAM protein [Planctomycetota bacterium]|nr:radical SAM protein [Planctomycetota bacterium]
MTQIVLDQHKPAGVPTDGLEQLRRSIGRLEDAYTSLPVATRATCPICRKVVDAKFDRRGNQIILTYNCPDCGNNAEVHADTIWSGSTGVSPVKDHGRDGHATHSPTHTLSGSPIQPLLRRLPRTVETLCPQCCAVIPGRYFVEDGAVYIEKTCPQHGHFRDCISSDALLYSKSAWWSFEDAPGRRKPARQAGRCPSECGLCGQHLSASCLAQIDLTNRCNMRCPICFANSGVNGYVFEPTFEQIVDQLRVLREMDPTPATAVQFTGGEPTIHPDFLRIVSTSAEMGFSHIQVATNGIKFADAQFTRAAAEAGLHVLYLQFDGVGEEPHRQTRNYPGIWEKKLACIENCRKVGLKICLVPTILKGVNNEQVGEVFRFAIANIDVVSGISYQPVSFSGRADPSQVAACRYTLGDLAHDIAAASGAESLRDMYPLSIVAPLGQFLQAITGDPKIRPSCHPDCAFGTYFLVSPDGRAYPFPQVVDVEGMFCDMNRLGRRIEKKGRMTWMDKMAVFRMFRRHFHSEHAPPGLDVKKFVRSLHGLVDKNLGRGDGEKHTYRTLLCAGMHFQDRYNYNVQRLKRCVILYSTPEGIFPFCSYNCGPEYRALVERKHSKLTATKIKQ